MQKLPGLLRRGIIYLSALVLVAGYPITAMADTQEPTTTAPTTVAPTPPAGETKKEPAYTYNPETGTWDSKQWKFNPETGTYERPPKPVVIEPETPPTDQSSVDKNVDTNVKVDTNVTSDATTGNSTVAENTKAGNATTGDASSIATILNTVNSTVGTGNNQKVATFTQDILGDVKGDIILYPTLLKAMLEAEATQGSGTINAQTNMDVANNVNVSATSGDASVTGNTEAGNATTGSAHAVANVVNILNSMIAAQDSFIGTINIYGNLEGDILVAPDFIPQMLASNGGESSGDMKVSTQDTTTIVNNISAVAESGAASVFGNTTGGSASTGDAKSNVVIFNVSGHDIIAKNSLLVFVNVLGTWVGMIVDAPANATAAMVGNGVTKNEQYKPDLTVAAQSNQGITNTIAVTANSGDATVANNTTGGNATTGNATALANVANVSNSQFGFSDWFGVLFINVYQSWHGSFGIDTSYGNTVKEEAGEQPKNPIEFIPAGSQQTTRERVRINVVDSRFVQSDSVNENVAVSASPTVLGVSSDMTNTNTQTEEKPEGETLANSLDYRIWIVVGSLFVIGVSVLGLRRLIAQ